MTCTTHGFSQESHLWQKEKKHIPWLLHSLHSLNGIPANGWTNFVSSRSHTSSSSLSWCGVSDRLLMSHNSWPFLYLGQTSFPECRSTDDCLNALLYQFCSIRFLSVRFHFSSLPSFKLIKELCNSTVWDLWLTCYFFQFSQSRKFVLSRKYFFPPWYNALKKNKKKSHIIFKH